MCLIKAYASYSVALGAEDMEPFYKGIVMALEIHQILSYTDNYTYILICSQTGEAAAIDVGEAKPLFQFLNKSSFRLAKIFSTHHHFDHTGGNLEIKRETNCKIIGAEQDRHRIPGIDKTVCDGDEIQIGRVKGKILETWGHTRGHISIYFPEDKALFTGDTLFSIGCGRLFEGSSQEMFESLSKISSLPDETQIYCAHEYTLSNLKFALHIDRNNEELLSYEKKMKKRRENGESTIPSRLFIEKKFNPFLRCKDENIRSFLKMQKNTDVEVFQTLRELKDRFLSTPLRKFYFSQKRL